MNPTHKEALLLHQNGITSVPILPANQTGEKKPAIPWKNLTHQNTTETALNDWYNNREYGIGILTGTPSNDVIMVELEGTAAHHFATLTNTAKTQGLTQLWQTITSGWCEITPSGGYHWYMRVPGTTHRNTKLAKRPATPTELEQSPEKTKTLAETRGTGGYSVIAPTGPTFSHKNRAWTRLSGGPQTIATLTETEFNQILDLFRTLDETPQPEPEQAPLPAVAVSTPGRQRPGDQYNEQTPWEHILTGWQKHHQDSDGTIHWTRPGKPLSEGPSATTGHSTDGIDRLYVFSTSTEFPTEEPINKFRAYSILNHNGNDQAAARELAKQGYGDQLQNITIDLPTTPPRPQLHVIEGTSALQPNPQIQVQHSGDLTEASAARYIADAYHQQIRYITNSDRWIHWNGHAWKPTGKNAGPIKQLTIQAIENLPTQTKEEHAYRKRLLNSAGINATLTLTATDPRITIEQNQLDTHHGELNTPGGTINLHTGKLTPPNPNHLHTRTTLTTPQPTPTPMWNKFLTETFHGHPGVTNYVQQLAGYSATGYIRSQILPFLHGAGANGKSVLAEVLQQLLNDYAEPAPANFLMQTQQQHPTEIARLQGARLVIASEVPEGARFDEVKVKQLTGGDTLTARYMHGDFFTFQPTHKLWLLGNHQPKVSAGGYSFWRRLRQIPFTNTVPEQNRVEDLAHKLIEQEGAGILQWVIQGAAQYLNHGLTEPAEVLEATHAYEESEDALRRFTDDRLNIGGGDYARITYKDMRNAYAEWCRLEGIKPTTASAFTREMQTRFNIGTTKSNGARHYTNCTLLEDPDEPETDTDSPWADLGGGTKW